MKFIHAADLHLDSPFEGLQHLPKTLWQRVHEAPFKATEKNGYRRDRPTSRLRFTGGGFI